jgi:hypothetical protein
MAGLTAVGMQVRCLDAAREAARLAARGDQSATQIARGIAPDGAAVDLHRDGGVVVARVSARSALLPGITVAAQAVSAAEPGTR